jgi:hypothetical protein
MSLVRVQLDAKEERKGHSETYLNHVFVCASPRYANLTKQMAIK